MAAEHEWEMLPGSESDKTERMKVPGGWVYARSTSTAMPGEFAVAMCFVPEVFTLQACVGEFRKED